MNTMTLRDIAEPNEIDYLLRHWLILDSHVDEAPSEIRELSGGATEIDYRDGLTVTIYDNAEPIAIFK